MFWLLRQGGGLVVSSPEVTDQDTFKQDAKNLFDHRRAPTFGYQVVAELLGGKRGTATVHCLPFLVLLP